MKKKRLVANVITVAMCTSLASGITAVAEESESKLGVEEVSKSRELNHSESLSDNVTTGAAISVGQDDDNNENYNNGIEQDNVSDIIKNNINNVDME